MITWLALGACALGAVLWAASRGAYYRKLFSETHFTEIHGKLVDGLAEAQREIENAPLITVVTSAGFAIALSLTHAKEANQRLLHISLSQPGGPPTATAASRLAFFIVAILDRNSMELAPFVSRDGVYHLAMVGGPDALSVNPMEHCWERLQHHYTPIRWSTAPAA